MVLQAGPNLLVPLLVLVARFICALAEYAGRNAVLGPESAAEMARIVKAEMLRNLREIHPLALFAQRFLRFGQSPRADIVADRNAHTAE